LNYAVFTSISAVRIGFEISELSVREDAGTLENSLYIIRNGSTEQTLTIQLQFFGFEIGEN